MPAKIASLSRCHAAGTDAAISVSSGPPRLYIFFLNIPICALALLVGGISLGRLRSQMAWNRRALDLWGSLLLPLALGSLVLALTRLRETGWGDGRTEGLLALGLTRGSSPRCLGSWPNGTPTSAS